MLKELQLYQNQHFFLRKKENNKNRANRIVRKQRIDNRNGVKISDEQKVNIPRNALSATYSNVGA